MAKTTIPAGYIAANAITATEIANGAIPTSLTVYGRSANTSVSVSNATLTVVGRSANVSVGVS